MKIIAACLFFCSIACAEPRADIDTAAFERQTAEALALRKTRILDSDAFLKMLADGEVLLLDTRSKWAYDAKHLKGAVHLNFSDFSVEKLAKVIPSKTTTVLIYCNNNVLGDPINFQRKASPLALNIPTFVNLYGYGYQDVYELGALLKVDDPRLEFEGSATP